MVDLSRNKLIDGWRGLSVLGVVVAHLVTYRYPGYFNTSPIHTLLEERASVSVLANNLFFRLASPLGDVGVNFFFVISGYLITHFLLVEERNNSKISIAAFYLRRAFRIMPAFYVFLLVVLILRKNGMIVLDDSAFFRSGLYVCNFSEFKCSWWLAHTWSLSVEEQFYLVWPLVFSLLTKSRLVIIYTMFATLTAVSFFFPTFGSFAYIAIGAVVASSDSVRNITLKLATTPVIAFTSVVLFLKPLLLIMPILITPTRLVEPALVALVFFGTIAGRGPLVWLVSMSPIQKIGLISYSIYLWQQLATAPLIWGNVETGAAVLNENYLLPLFILAPIASYFLIEQPMIALGRNLSSRIAAREKVVAQRDIFVESG